MRLDDWRAAGARFDHRGHSIFYRIAGEPDRGSALLCIHGFPTASWDWHRLWDTLCARFGCVVAPDMIGFGFSPKPRGYAYSLFDQAELHERLLAHVGIRRVHVFAHDYGDTVAQELIARHGERRARGDQELVIESVCLLNGGLFPETHRATFVQKLVAGPLGPIVSRMMTERAVGRSLARVFGPNTRPTEAELHDFWRLIAENDGHLISHDLLAYMAERREHRARWVGALQTTDLPLRLIDGLDDPVSGREMVARYRELIPNPDVVELPGIGHYPQVEAPDDVIRGFLAFHDRLAG